MKKLLSNLGYNAWKTLGTINYLILIYCVAKNLMHILKDKNLVTVDSNMPKKRYKIKHKMGLFSVDTASIDKNIQETNSFAFGSIRELYIRDCYFKYHNIDPKDLKTILDLGANRGLFSTMCTSFAKRIIAVECQEIYESTIKNNLNHNNFKNYKIIKKYLGNNGTFDKEDYSHITMNQLLEDENIDTVDFLKMDIEGAEFSLFNDSFPYKKIRYLSMEVHPTCGSPGIIIDMLKKHNFTVITATSDLSITTDVDQVEYIYGIKQ